MRSFLTDESTSLVHGNELLQTIDASYPVTKLRGVSKHTVTAVLDALEGVEPPVSPTADLVSAADWFVGYLLLDAVIANGDRHHENWGVLQASKGARRLAPSYDHATSMGRELKDEERLTRLHGGDRPVRWPRTCSEPGQLSSRTSTPSDLCILSTPFVSLVR